MIYSYKFTILFHHLLGVDESPHTDRGEQHKHTKDDDYTSLGDVKRVKPVNLVVELGDLLLLLLVSGTSKVLVKVVASQHNDKDDEHCYSKSECDEISPSITGVHFCFFLS